MAATQLGTDLLLTPGTTISNYIIESRELDKEVKSEDVLDEDGVLKTRIIYQTMDRINLTLIPVSSKAETDVRTDFPKGAICTIAALNTYYVEDCKVARSSGPAKVTVSLIALGITT